ncbi:Methionine biosynthesis protein MetW [gamma proteobacterium IMCC2047]|nr:Methionine biosynthesis protein MetW [gamma proteobacterium IMCC2047]
MSSRADFDILQQWVRPSSRVLDLGCGDGGLLQSLAQQKNVQGYGIENDRALIVASLNNGINVIEQNLNDGLTDFTDNSFDTVLMTQALQVVSRPDQVLEEMLRVGKECIVTFPNFGNWRARWHLAIRGRMPVTKQLDYEWYNTPNIHFCTVRDFEVLCRERGIQVLNRVMVSERFPDQSLKQLCPNSFAETAIYHLSK